MRNPVRAIVSVLLIVAVVVAAVVFVPRLTHTCDNCGEFFVGTGYEANVVSNALTQLTDCGLCKECAAKEHALAIATGKSLSDFKRPLFAEEE